MNSLIRALTSFACKGNASRCKVGYKNGELDFHSSVSITAVPLHRSGAGAV